MVDLGPTSSQELLDGSLLTFHGLVELYKGLITFVFISQSLKGRCHGIQRKSENWPFCRKKNFFATLLCRNGLECRNSNGHLKRELNVATSCTTLVRFGLVTPEKRLLIFVLL